MIEPYHPDAATRSYLLFVQTADAVLKYADAVLFRYARLSVIKLMVLQVLEYSGGTMEPSRIAEYTLREPHGITTLVKRMQKERLVVAARNQKDRRRVNVTLTDEGRKLVYDIIPVARQIIQDIMQSLREEDSLQLEKLLRVMRKNAREGILRLTQRL